MTHNSNLLVVSCSSSYPSVTVDHNMFLMVSMHAEIFSTIRAHAVRMFEDCLLVSDQV